MDGYGQFCPVAIACEVFAHRWTPLILRELFAGARQFNEIRRGLPRISKTTLTQRLRALESAGVVTCEAGGLGRPTSYQLTSMGREFAPVIQSLAAWGQRSSLRFDPENLDPELLMWNIRRRLATERLPAKRTLVRFSFTGLPARVRRARMFWLVIEGGSVELCLKDPGDELDLRVEADLKSFAQLWLGEVDLQALLDSDKVRLRGRSGLVKAFPSWLLLSRFSPLATSPFEGANASRGGTSTSTRFTRTQA
jgi:DNA-binding HxlR family transcriptional regulator